MHVARFKRQRGHSREWSWVSALALALWLLAACGSPAASTGAGGPTAAPATAAPASGGAPAGTAATTATTSSSAAVTPTAAATTAPSPTASAVQAGATAQASPTPSAAAATPTAGTSAATGGGAAAGRQLFVAKGCVACHGDNAEGKIGPKIAGTGLTFAEVLHQVRQPRGQMPPFSAQQVSDAEVQQIYTYLESLAPPTPTAMPAAQGAPSTVNADAIVGPVSDLKTASDYAKDASKSMQDLKTYTGQATTALQAAQAAVQAATASGGGSPELRATLAQLSQGLAAVAPEVQAAAAATSLDAAAPHTAAMVLASRIELLPLALEVVRLNGETGSVVGTVKDTSGKPVPQAFVTIGGGKIHTGLMTDANGSFSASGIAAFRAVDVKAYKAGSLYVENHAPVTKGGTASVTITLPAENNPPASPQVSDTFVTPGPIGGSATAHFAMKAVQKDNRIAEDQVWALSPEAGVAYVLRQSGGNNYTVDQPLPGLKAGSYTWYFFATTHECDMSNVLQQKMTVQ